MGTGLPGRSWCDGGDNVHVGIQRKRDIEELVAGDAEEARWDITVDVVGEDFKGPHVQGKKGERFLYLSWGTVHADGTFAMFRRSKLMIGAIDVSVLRAADRPGHRLVGTLGLTGGDGGPVCAAVRPPKIEWSAVVAER